MFREVRRPDSGAEGRAPDAGIGTMTTLTETEVEQATLDRRLVGLGWRVARGPDVAPGSPAAERR